MCREKTSTNVSSGTQFGMYFILLDSILIEVFEGSNKGSRRDCFGQVGRKSILSERMFSVDTSTLSFLFAIGERRVLT